MRGPLLKHHPQARAVTMRDLVGIAHAVEQEAMRRYGELAETMERRGAHDTAAAFRRMLEDERRHVEALVEWASGLDEAVPASQQLEWRLPPEIADSWTETAGSALLTPYRAFAIAVRNAERAAALYIYLSAHAKDPKVRTEAERLAAETLSRASHLRRWRRTAYRQDRARPCEPRRAVGTIADLQDFLSRRETAIVACLCDLAARLREVGDEESASLLETLIEGRDQGAAPADRRESCKRRASDPVHLLIAGQKPLERLSEELERILETSHGEIADAAEKALSKVVHDLRRIAAQIERRLQQP